MPAPIAPAYSIQAADDEPAGGRQAEPRRGCSGDLSQVGPRADNFRQPITIQFQLSQDLVPPLAAVDVGHRGEAGGPGLGYVSAGQQPREVIADQAQPAYVGPDRRLVAAEPKQFGEHKLEVQPRDAAGCGEPREPEPRLDRCPEVFSPPVGPENDRRHRPLSIVQQKEAIGLRGKAYGLDIR